MSWLKGLKARARSVTGAHAAEARKEEEFAFHVDMETERLVVEGLPPDEARRRALITFGGMDSHREAMRDGRGRRWFDDFHESTLAQRSSTRALTDSRQFVVRNERPITS